jgi:hypothetical protein
MDCKSSGNGDAARAKGFHGTLTDRAVRMWGTPVARDDQKSPEAHLAMKQPRWEATSLTVHAKMWPTPTARDTKGQDQPNRQGGPSLVNAVRFPPAQTTPTDGDTGSPKADLNPRFVAALMGVPWDWAMPCTVLEMASYQAWLRTHSCNSPTGQGCA